MTQNFIVTLPDDVTPEAVARHLKAAGAKPIEVRTAGPETYGVMLTDHALSVIWDTGTGAEQCHGQCQHHVMWHDLLPGQRYALAQIINSFISNEIENTFDVQYALDDCPPEMFKGVATQDCRNLGAAHP